MPLLRTYAQSDNWPIALSWVPPRRSPDAIKRKDYLPRQLTQREKRKPPAKKELTRATDLCPRTTKKRAIARGL